MAMLFAKTESGMIQGQYAPNQFHSLFRGIPFAAPPVGELRWKAPQPVKEWEGVYQANDWKAICPQRPWKGGGIAGKELFVIDPPMDEDCLYLNIWTPAKEPGEKLPVAIWFHGGGYQHGYSYNHVYDGDAFCKRGVILVTAAFRLNVFGFFAHPDLAKEDEHHSSGNYGLLDQVAAIKWVRRNIEAFGGDPDNITIFGQSGGGMGVHSLLAFEGIHGDIKHAIMQSGGGISAGKMMTTPTIEEGYRFSAQIMRYIGCETVSQMRALPMETLLHGYLDYLTTLGGAWSPAGFSPAYWNQVIRLMGPKVDGYAMKMERSEYCLAGKHPNIDYMIGCISSEMYYEDPVMPPTEETIRHAYETFGDKAEGFLSILHLEDPVYSKKYFQDVCGDMLRAASVGFCENQIDTGMKPAYLYMFTKIPPELDRTHHTQEHHYIFQTLLRSPRRFSGEDFVLSNELADRWAAFMKSGSPNTSDWPEWKPYSAESREGLIIGDTREMGTVPLNDCAAYIYNYSLKRL